MAGARRRKLTVVLSLAVQVAAATWGPCPCSVGQGGAQPAADYQRQAPTKGGARCGLCENGREAGRCHFSHPLNRHTAGRDSALPGTPLADGHGVTSRVAVFDAPSPPSPDVERLQVRLE